MNDGSYDQGYDAQLDHSALTDDPALAGTSDVADLAPPVAGPAVGDGNNPMLTQLDSPAGTGAPPVAGQDKAIDPGDKGYGVGGTFDTSGPGATPKVTNVYVDPPVNAHGDPAQVDVSGGDKGGGGGDGKIGMDQLCGPNAHFEQNGPNGACVPNPNQPVPKAPDAPIASPDDVTSTNAPVHIML